MPAPDPRADDLAHRAKMGTGTPAKATYLRKFRPRPQTLLMDREMPYAIAEPEGREINRNAAAVFVIGFWKEEHDVVRSYERPKDATLEEVANHDVMIDKDQSLHELFEFIGRAAEVEFNSARPSA